MTNFCSYIILALMRLLSLLPLRVHYFLCRGVSLLAEHVFKYRRNVVKINLEHSFPEKDEKEIEEITHKFYRHFGDILAEAIWFGKYRRRETLRKKAICSFENVEGHKKDFEENNGVMVLTSHCGNWEIMGGWFAYAPYGELGYLEDAITVVYKSLSSKAWDLVMADNRLAPLIRTAFHGYVDSTKVLRYALENKGEKRTYIFPTDQYPYKYATKHEIGDFLGQETLTMTGGAALARKLGMAVEYMSFESVSRGKYRARFETICSGDEKLSPEEIMERYYHLLERDIKAQPWNYLWTHKRWKNLYQYK